MSNRNESLFLNDIIESINAIIEFTSLLDINEFSNNRLVYSATIREFEIIGEATTHLSNELLSQYDTVMWRDLKDFRNILIHEYFGVDHQIVWNTIQNDLPELKSVVLEMLNALR